jgi:hypothetical protein
VAASAVFESVMVAESSRSTVMLIRTSNPEVDRGRVDHCSVPFDYSCALQLAQPAVARTGAEPDSIGELGDGKPTLDL